jgi:hypothetical protein
MLLQFLIPLIGLITKLFPLLYQFKIIRSEADLKELQRRFEAAMRKAEAGSLDSIKLKQQHDENKKELDEKYDKVWGNGGTPTPIPTPADPNKPDGPTPDVKNAYRIEAPDKVKTREPFRIILHNFPENGVTLYADRFKLMDVGVNRSIYLDVKTSGNRMLIVKINGKEVASHKIVVEEGD